LCLGSGAPLCLPRLAVVVRPDVIVASSVVLIDGDDGALAVVAESIVSGFLQAQVIFSGGTLDLVYTHTNRVTTSTGANEC